MEQFPNIVDVKFSADMEKKLDVVEAGQADWVKTCLLYTSQQQQIQRTGDQ